MFPMNRPMPAGEEEDPRSRKLIGAAIEVHRELGPGLTEAVYENALCHELDLQGIKYERQVVVDVLYKGVVVGTTRLDLIIEDALIVELKAVETLLPVHKSQCVTYKSITKFKVALLINFNVSILKDGIKRVALSH